jgi:hypothetical protein
VSVNEEYLRLVFETKGQQAIDDAQKDVAALNSQVAALGAQFKAGTITEKQWSDDLEKLATKLSGARAQVQGLENVAKGGGKATKDLGGGFLELSRAVEDAQYGLGGVLNNIPNMIQRFGGPAGLAAGVSLTAVAFNMLLPHLMTWIESMGLFEKATDLGTTAVEKLQTRIKELEDKKVKLAVDTLELDAAKAQVEQIRAAIQAVETLKKSRGHYEKESGSAIAEMFAEAPGGGEAVHDRLRAQIVREQEGHDTTLNDARAKQAKTVAEIEAMTKDAEKYQATGQGDMLDWAKEQIRTLQVRAKKEAEDAQKAMTAITRQGGKADFALGGLIDTAENGTGAKQFSAQQELARRLKQAGLGDLGEGVKAASASNLMNMDAVDEMLDRQIEGAKDRGRREKERIQKAEAAARALAQTPEFKEQEQKSRLQGGVDEFGRHFGQAGFDADSAHRVMVKEQGRIKPVPKDIHKLPDRPTEAQRRKTREGRYQEQLAHQVYNEGGGAFSPDQAREIAGQSIGMQKQGLDANSATLMAMGQAMQAMQQLQAQAQQQMVQARQLGMGFRQLTRQAENQGRTFQNHGAMH